MTDSKSITTTAAGTTGAETATASTIDGAEPKASKNSNSHDEEEQGITKSRTAPFIVRFYGQEQAADSEGRTLEDICAFDDDQLEYHHDYIQILFPLPERSGVNHDAPLIDKDTRDAFLEHEHLRKSLFKAFRRMARFYAFDVEGDETECLRILGLDQVAQIFHQALVDNERGISPRSLMYWERAAKRPLHLPPDQPDGSKAGFQWLKE
ncbi:hypothetical protein PRZ48_006166 [Zasmidium cellare]|uniref:Opioid growth factor receptor (OGFr) conserved domain-containing protein n=1 Tax=Zasmidium cellare TaxID=395010 RepID=A0ABR0ENJ2_ZASCE|nr:hypothetical protein PRZ48_006166 [Zasmidium cellare]